MDKEIYLAGGCFWGVEKYLSLLPGVRFTEVGYANGNTQNPTYQQVCYCNTGHAETVKVVYDGEALPLQTLLQSFFMVIDPTSHNRQGHDMGVQYRTGIYYTDANDLPVIQKSIGELQKHYDMPIAIEVLPLGNYSKAEDYHQKYLDQNPGGYCHIPHTMFEKAKSMAENPYRKPAKEMLKKKLPDLSYRVTMENATEPPFQNAYYDEFREGIYVDITTGEPLFVSTDKFESGCGWPAFAKPIDSSLIVEKKDTSFGMHRTEVRSKTGDAHLGHVFSDGPKEKGGLRYCINSASLRFIEKENMEKEGYGRYLSLFSQNG